MARRSKGKVEDKEEDVPSEEADIEEDLDVPTPDGDIDYDDDFDDIDEGGGSVRSRRSSIDDLKAIEPEVVLQVNPKRAQSQRKEARPLDGVSSTNELTNPEVATKIWKKFEKAHGKDKAKDYKLSDDYSLEDIINHPTFGRGYVVEIMSNTKFAVLFEDGLRRLMYNVSNK